jgi:hypothetical protein
MPSVKTLSVSLSPGNSDVPSGTELHPCAIWHRRMRSFLINPHGRLIASDATYLTGMRVSSSIRGGIQGHALWLLLIFAGCAMPSPAQDTVRGRAANPHGELRMPCENCHTTTAWKPVRRQPEFNHNTQTSYPLLGMHEAVACQTCHVSKADEPSTVPVSCLRRLLAVARIVMRTCTSANSDRSANSVTPCADGK